MPLGGTNYSNHEEASRDPVYDLCDLIRRRTGAVITTPDMEAMFRSDWSKLSTLAHAIHDRQIYPREQTSANSQGGLGGLW